MSEVKAFDPYISTTVVGTVAAMAERKLGGFIQRCDYDKLTEQNKILRAELNNFVYLAAMLRNGCKLSEAQYTANQLLGVGGCGGFDKYENELLYYELVGKYMTKIDAKTIEAIK